MEGSLEQPVKLENGIANFTALIMSDQLDGWAIAHGHHTLGAQCEGRFQQNRFQCPLAKDAADLGSFVCCGNSISVVGVSLFINIITAFMIVAVRLFVCSKEFSVSEFTERENDHFIVLSSRSPFQHERYERLTHVGRRKSEMIVNYFIDCRLRA